MSWDAIMGPGATFPEDDDSITHQIIDRPVMNNQRINRYCSCRI